MSLKPQDVFYIVLYSAERRTTVKDSSQPNHGLFSPLHSGKGYRGMRTNSETFRLSYTPQATIALKGTSFRHNVLNLNSTSHTHWLGHPYHIDIHIHNVYHFCTYQIHVQSILEYLLFIIYCTVFSCTVVHFMSYILCVAFAQFRNLRFRIWLQYTV